jgi:phage tail-like protein
VSAYALGGRAGWRAAEASAISVERALTSNAAGVYRSTAFDGQLKGCAWDRLRFEAHLPSGTSLTFSTYTSDTDRGDAAIAVLDESEWTAPVTVAGAFSGRSDALVRSDPGRYLWLRIALTGTAAASAELRRLDLSFPRNTSLRMLPAIYSTAAGGRDFNERLLSLFDAMRDEVKGEIQTLAAVIDPRTTDAATQRDFLDWLGTWFNLELFRAWPIARRRAVVHHAGELFRLRGTARGIERFVELALGRNITIVEGWVDRHWWFAGGPLLGASVLFGPEIAGRAATDGTNVLSTKLIDSVPSVLLDPFSTRANRMTVYVPCRSEPTDDDLTMLAEVLNVQKPAHVALCIVLTSPDLRLGVTARLGLDAVIGELAPPAILAGSAPLRLGVNATLGGRS